MPKKFSEFLYLFSTFFFLIIVAWLSSKIIAHQYQKKGGTIINNVIDKYYKGDFGISICENEPRIDEHTSEQVKFAIDYFQKAIQYNGSLAYSYLQLGRSFCLLDDTQNAIIAFESYLNYQSNNPLGHLELAFAYESLCLHNRTNNQICRNDFYTEKIRYEYLESGVDIQNFIDNGVIMINNMQYSSALIWLTRALWLDPESEDAYYQVGQVYLNQEEWETAKNWFGLGIDMFPSYPHLNIGYGWAMYELGYSIQLVKEEFLESIELDDTNGDGYYAIGQLLTREGNYSEADIWFEQAIERNPDRQRWYIARGNAAREAGKYNAAIENYLEGIALFPEFAASYYQISLAYLLNNQPEKATDAIEFAIELMGRPDERYHIRAGQIYESTGDLPKAKTAYLTALQIDPNNKTAKERLLSMKDN
jgi:tetratricopeptide (TPR) repeat protein